MTSNRKFWASKPHTYLSITCLYMDNITFGVGGGGKTREVIALSAPSFYRGSWSRLRELSSLLRVPQVQTGGQLVVERFSMRGFPTAHKQVPTRV